MSLGLLWTKIGQSYGPLADNTQHEQKRDIYASAWFEPAIPVYERPRIHFVDGKATPIDVFQ